MPVSLLGGLLAGVVGGHHLLHRRLLLLRAGAELHLREVQLGDSGRLGDPQGPPPCSGWVLLAYIVC